MVISTQHLAAERGLRELLPGTGLPQPDEVEYHETSVVFLWHEIKLAVVVDLDDPAPEAGAPQHPSRRAHEPARTEPEPA
jgi:hypothetical protein